MLSGFLGIGLRRNSASCQNRRRCSYQIDDCVKKEAYVQKLIEKSMRVYRSSAEVEKANKKYEVCVKEKSKKIAEDNYD